MILLELKWAHSLVPNLAHLERQHRISHRTPQKVRAKLSRLGLIERVSRLNSRYRGREGWKLSGRFASGLRTLADKLDRWQRSQHPGLREKERLLTHLLE
jgi:hypothetical protein